MTDKPINLNRARKSRARAAAKAEADENAVRFGRTKAQVKRDETEAAKAARHIDDHKREP
ncbi:protein of unknown function [Roseovarius nanhaiticus]|uniref:DUF4169 domain-containing protein n=1 Tax=Roseovarius nanhaiticus TaxID=573024 RepID=A0A1N7HFZ4_9RHOB|nr:DUF4169 family protein [Roseovarius nanhaiticus]SEK96905.1 protein of unknown function [Roseovarius nanhaiticus]SIS23789.1 protein of unknown function [Roseovarius nanhaiticus]